MWHCSIACKALPPGKCSKRCTKFSSICQYLAANKPVLTTTEYYCVYTCSDAHPNTTCNDDVRQLPLCKPEIAGSAICDHDADPYL